MGKAKGVGLIQSLHDKGTQIRVSRGAPGIQRVSPWQHNQDAVGSVSNNCPRSGSFRPCWPLVLNPLNSDVVSLGACRQAALTQKSWGGGSELGLTAAQCVNLISTWLLPYPPWLQGPTCLLASLIHVVTGGKAVKLVCQRTVLRTLSCLRNARANNCGRGGRGPPLRPEVTEGN